MAWRLLLVDPDPVSARLLSFSLTQEGYEVTVLSDATQMIPQVRRQLVDIVVAEAHLPGSSSAELCRQLRADWRTRFIPVVLLSSGSADERIAALQAGADNCLIRPYPVLELLIELRRLIHSYGNCSCRDPLTRLPNSQVLEAYVDEKCLLDAAADWVLMTVDVNHFRAFNRLYGHAAGSAVLLITAEILRNIVLLADDHFAFVARHHGGRFVALIAADRSAAVCGELISAFDQQIGAVYPSDLSDRRHQVIFDRRGNPELAPSLALSIGVVSSEFCSDMSYAELYDAVEDVLHKAKQSEQSAVYTNRRQLVGRNKQGA